MTLKVFKMLGREVAMLENGEIITGSYEATLDAKTLAGGVNFYRP